jgi:hypothetical protein
MWEFEYSVDTLTARSRIWARYADPGGWPEFDRGLEQVRLVGPFAAGTRGILITREWDPRGRDPVRFVLSHVQPDRGFTAVNEIPGVATVRFVHRLTELGGGRTRITHRVEIDGPFAPELGPELGPRITSMIPGIVATLVTVASAETARA